MVKSSTDYQQFEARKADHIQYALDNDNQTAHLSKLDEIQLQHEALPNLDFNEISLASACLSTPCRTPFFVSSMTAGHQGGVKINQTLARACEEMQWPMGVGSQRRQLTDPSAAAEWHAVRELAPTTLLFGNIGIAQIIQTPIGAIQRLADSIDAAGMIIHLNPLQECLQPEGTPQFRGGEQAIAALASKLSVPLIIKETGCGFSRATCERLLQIPLGAIDISGAGGTHWGRIEGKRANSNTLKQSAVTFRNWGINTVTALRNLLSCAPTCEIWGSGGVRSGLDAAKLIALGADRIGVAKPMLEAALVDVESTCHAMQQFETELKIAMFCTGSATIHALREDKLCR